MHFNLRRRDRELFLQVRPCHDDASHGARKENLFLLTAYNTARKWNAARRQGGADEENVMALTFFNDPTLDRDGDD